MGEEDSLDGLKKQVELYQELLALTKEEHDLLKEGKDTSEIKEEQRELRDEIQNIDLKHDIDQTDKLRLIKESDVEELQQFEPVLKELYALEKKNQAINS